MTRNVIGKTLRLAPLAAAAAMVASGAHEPARRTEVLFEFDGTSGSRPTDVPVIDSSGVLTGTARYGGPGNRGVLYRFVPRTRWMEVLHRFSGSPDGAEPMGVLSGDSDGRVFGTTMLGGSAGAGTIFRWDPSAAPTSRLSVLHSFDGANGAAPFGGVTRDADGNLFGVTFYGGTGTCSVHGCGTVFRYSPVLASARPFQRLHSFSGPDGYGPVNLVLREGFLYGGTYYGSRSPGVLFKIPAAGMGPLSVIYYGSTEGFAFNYAPVRGTDGKLYGTASAESTLGHGAIFSLTPSGEYRLLHRFDGSHGSGPAGHLIHDPATNKLYGVTVWGGNGFTGAGQTGHGTVFEFDINTARLTELHRFNGANGSKPGVGLVRDASGNLYGVTMEGGSSSLSTPAGGRGHGVLFRVTP